MSEIKEKIVINFDGNIFCFLFRFTKWREYRRYKLQVQTPARIWSGRGPVAEPTRCHQWKIAQFNARNRQD